jgi:hypothetical protein
MNLSMVDASENQSASPGSSEQYQWLEPEPTVGENVSVEMSLLTISIFVDSHRNFRKIFKL